MNANQRTSTPTSNMTASSSPSPRRTKSEFPIKVYAMLELADNIFEFAQAVTWLPHGRAFRIHNKVKFMKEVVPLFFNQTKIRSFNRQLHLWGFRRSGRGNDQVWYHDNFLRGKPEDMKLMVRTKIKGNTGGSSEDMRVPNFDVLPPLPVCNKQPSAILDVMENAVLKLTNSIGAIAHCGSAMPTMSHPQLGNVTAGNNYQMMVLPSIETPFQFNVIHRQDNALEIPPPPTFHRSVSNESQFMMQPCVPTTPTPLMSYHLPQQVDYIEPSPAEHQTSIDGPMASTMCRLKRSESRVPRSPVILKARIDPLCRQPGTHCRR